MTTPLYRIVPGHELTSTEARAVLAIEHDRTGRTMKQLAFYFDHAGNYLGVYRDL